MAEPGDRMSSQPSQGEERPHDKKKTKNGPMDKWKKKLSPISYTTEKKSDFKGGISDLNGHVFEVGSDTTKSNQFAQTVEEIGVYMARKYDYGSDITRMLREEKELDFEAMKPPYPVKDGDTKPEQKVALKIWERKINKFADREDQYVRNKEALFSIIWAQCSDNMKAKVRTSKDYKTLRQDQDCLSLLQEIQGITYKFESQRYPYEAFFDAMLSFFQNRQNKHQSNSCLMHFYGLN